VSKKSERGHLSRSKRKKSKNSSFPTAAQQKPVAQVADVPHLDVPASTLREVAKGVTLDERRQLNVSVELRRIGILAGIMLSVLVVLALVLP